MFIILISIESFKYCLVLILIGCTPMYMRNIADIWKDICIADILELYEIARKRR